MCMSVCKPEGHVLCKLAWCARVWASCECDGPVLKKIGIVTVFLPLFAGSAKKERTLQFVTHLEDKVSA
jgi:hypothetical protein